MYYKLIRTYKDEGTKAVRGMLYRTSHYFNNRSNEYREVLHPVCPTLENASYLVPALVYRVEVTQSPKFGRLLPVLCGVPGRSGIRFHYGTRPSHSKGCILVSKADEKNLTSLWLGEIRGKEEVRVEIVEEI